MNLGPSFVDEEQGVDQLKSLGWAGPPGHPDSTPAALSATNPSSPRVGFVRSSNLDPDDPAIQARVRIRFAVPVHPGCTNLPVQPGCTNLGLSALLYSRASADQDGRLVAVKHGQKA